MMFCEPSNFYRLSITTYSHFAMSLVIAFYSCPRIFIGSFAPYQPFYSQILSPSPLLLSFFPCNFLNARRVLRSIHVPFSIRNPRICVLGVSQFAIRISKWSVEVMATHCVVVWSQPCFGSCTVCQYHQLVNFVDIIVNVFWLLTPHLRRISMSFEQGSGSLSQRRSCVNRIRVPDHNGLPDNWWVVTVKSI